MTLTTNEEEQQPWFADHANLVILTNWMADNGFDASEVAYAVEKPWKFEDEYHSALEELAKDREEVLHGRQLR